MRLNGFLLTCNWRDTADGFEIILYAKCDDSRVLKARVTGFKPMFFISRETPAGLTGGCLRKPLPMTAMDGTPVDCLYFSTVKAARQAAQNLRMQGIPVYESDVHPVERFLMERDVRGCFICEGDVRLNNGAYEVLDPKIRGCDAAPPGLRVLSIDIETNADTGEIYSIACTGDAEAVFMAGESGAESAAADAGVDRVRFCGGETTMLRDFFAHVKSEDPDVIIGWNVVDFDLETIQRRCEALRVPFDLGRGGRCSVYPSAGRSRGMIARIPGRVVMDVPVTLRSLSMTYEEYSLDFIAAELLGRRKLVTAQGREKIDEINRRFHEDKAALARYNLEDARLTRAVFDKADLLANAIERSRLTGHLLDSRGGSVASFDFLYLPRLHRAGYVAIDTADVRHPGGGLQGGYVMDPAAGIHENVLVFDFRSLYPSLIVTFGIDPLARILPSDKRITGPAGVSFARDGAILPGIIAHLLEQRTLAKQNRNSALSYAIKILMNSFYGVLGTPGCRFFAVELAETITGTGQTILKETRRFIEESCGLTVIYGDTDSLFVALGPDRHESARVTGQEVAGRVNAWLGAMIKERFDADSALLLQFENHFRHFLLPNLRGGLEGSKKHYCGVIENGDEKTLVFKGMESARSDWTPIAKQFQHELCMRLFYGQPVDDYVRQTVAAVRAGRCDEKLLYKKRLRKNIDEYAVNVPPHAQAAKLMESPGHVIRYFVTTQGPQPAGRLTAPLDYEHYVECQLKPVADSLLEWRGTSFGKIVGGQTSLFD